MSTATDPNKAIAKNLTQPASWWDAFKAQAEKEGMNLSKWVGRQCLAALPEKAKKQLNARPAAHRPKNMADQ